MRRKPFLAFAILMSLSFACSSAPSRKARSQGGDDAVKIPDGRPDTETPGGPNTSNPAMPDAIALKETLEKILQPAGGSQDAECSAKTLAAKPQLRKLTQDEYQNTLKDILQITSDFRGRLPTDIAVLGFKNNADAGVLTDSHAEMYLDVAVSIADEIKPKLPTLIACSESDGLTCATKFVETLGPRLFRRPIEEGEKAELLNLHKLGAASSPREGMSTLIVGMLMSPHFLYRSEIGKSGTLTPHELASAISYFFWGTAPDAELISKANSGELSSETALLAQAERLWQNPRSKYAAVEFSHSWLESKKIRGSSKDPNKFPAFQDPIKLDMATEADETLAFILKSPGAKFETLFLNDFSIGSSNLANYYKGQSIVEDGVSKIKFPNTPRKGVLGLGAVLAHLATALETHPIKRGEFVLKNMFCHVSPPTPPGLEVQVPSPKEGMTTRERFAVHTSDPVCAGCHLPIDGIGFGMEDFDGAGIFRDMDNGKKVDSSGELHHVDDAVSKFSGVGDLSAYIAESKQAKRCYVIQWYRMARGFVERPADVCSIREVANKFEKGELSLSELLISIITRPSYSKRGE